MDRIHHFPKIISHRGVCRRHIENTIPALKAAKDENVDMIEMDVHETGDDRFIVVHDARLSPDTPPWRNLTYPQVQAVTGHDDRAPLLSDCLAAIRPVPVNIEIKHFRKADNFSKELEASPISEGSVVSSSHVDLLERLHTGGLGLPMMLVVSISRRRTLKENMRKPHGASSPACCRDFWMGRPCIISFCEKTSSVACSAGAAGCLSGPSMTGRIWRNLFSGKWTALFQIIPTGCKRSNIGLHLRKPDKFS